MIFIIAIIQAVYNDGYHTISCISENSRETEILSESITSFFYIFLEKIYKCPDTYRILLYHKNVFLHNSILWHKV